MDIRQAAELVKGVRPLFLDAEKASRVREKGPADFVTEVDTAVQEQIRKGLERLAPEAQFMGEEQENRDIDFSGSFWILDPVDGTTNLIHRFCHSAVSLAFCERGEITMGIIYQPYTEELFTAEKGKGAWLNGKRIFVGGREKLEESLVSVGTSPYRRKLAEQNFRDFQRVFLHCEDIRRLGSAAIELAYVAAGRTDAFFERDLKPWDFAAGILMVQEAGGEATDFSGRPVDGKAPSDIVAGNGKIRRILTEVYLGR